MRLDMKRSRNSCLCLLLFAVIFSCRKASGPADVRSAQQDNSIDSLLLMTASVNGVEWLTDSAYSYKVKKSNNDSASFNLKISATQIKNSQVSTITFDIADFSGVNEYPVNPPWNTATYYIGNVRHFATSGTIVVSSDTGNILSGTFNFVADTITVTNGTFNVALP